LRDRKAVSLARNRSVLIRRIRCWLGGEQLAKELSGLRLLKLSHEHQHRAKHQ
jgi:hypothetical protein